VKRSSSSEGGQDLKNGIVQNQVNFAQ